MAVLSLSWDMLYLERWSFNTLRLRQHGRHFADDTFNRIFLNENVGISIKISLKFVHKRPINNIPALVQIMVSEPVVGSLLTHICVTRPQWVNWNWHKCSLAFLSSSLQDKQDTTATNKYVSYILKYLNQHWCQSWVHCFWVSWMAKYDCAWYTKCWAMFVL